MYIPQFFDGHCPLSILEDVQQYIGPVAAIAKLAQVRERLLW